MRVEFVPSEKGPERLLSVPWESRVMGTRMKRTKEVGTCRTGDRAALDVRGRVHRRDGRKRGLRRGVITVITASQLGAAARIASPQQRQLA